MRLPWQINSAEFFGCAEFVDGVEDALLEVAVFFVGVGGFELAVAELDGVGAAADLDDGRLGTTRRAKWPAKLCGSMVAIW